LIAPVDAAAVEEAAIAIRGEPTKTWALDAKCQTLVTFTVGCPPRGRAAANMIWFHNFGSTIWSSRVNTRDPRK
jgi:hypothetical protein